MGDGEIPYGTFYQVNEGETVTVPVMVTVTVLLFPDTDPERQLEIPLTVTPINPEASPYRLFG